MLRGNGAAERNHERVRQARSGLVAGYEEVPRQVAACHLGEARTCEAPGGGHLQAHRSTARRDSWPTRDLDAVSLPREPAREAIHRASVALDSGAGWPVS